MLSTFSYKSKQFWWLVLKLLILGLLGYFIYDTLTNNTKITWEEFYIRFQNSSVHNPTVFLVLLTLTTLNWMLEIYKWQMLSREVTPISYQEAAKQSLASHAFALITPNRIGEYGAKALFYAQSFRKQILTLNFIGNIHQLGISMIFGCFGLVSLKVYFPSVKIPLGYDRLLIIPGLIILIFLFRCRIPFLQRWLNVFSIGTHINRSKLHRLVLFLSCMRYLVFMHQFFYLLMSFGIDIPYLEALSLIASVYLISSIIPMLAMFDFVVKGSVAVFIFSFWGCPPLIILSVTTLMWLLNFVFPAVIGSYYVLKFNPIES